MLNRGHLTWPGWHILGPQQVLLRRPDDRQGRPLGGGCHRHSCGLRALLRPGGDGYGRRRRRRLLLASRPGWGRARVWAKRVCGSAPGVWAQEVALVTLHLRLACWQALRYARLIGWDSFEGVSLERQSTSLNRLDKEVAPLGACFSVQVILPRGARRTAWQGECWRRRAAGAVAAEVSAA